MNTSNLLPVDFFSQLQRHTNQLLSFAISLTKNNVEAEDLYHEMVSSGVAKECARSVLPLNAPTRLYMNGTIRSWIHYIDLRTANGTQLEHQQIADSAKTIFIQQLPLIARALKWKR